MPFVPAAGRVNANRTLSLSALYQHFGMRRQRVPSVVMANILLRSLRRGPHILAMALAAPRYTIEELERLPDDGQRYELLDGFLLVTPAPGEDHQVVATRLATVLASQLPPEIRVTAPGVVLHGNSTQLQPDVLVYRGGGPIGRSWRGPRELWLAIEVLSPSSRIYDREFKRAAYLALGVDEVWLVDLERKAVYVRRTGAAPEERVTGALWWQPPAGGAPIRIDLGLLFASLE